MKSEGGRKKKKVETGHAASFDIFWQALHPERRVAKGYSLECWEKAIAARKIRADRDLISILDWLELAKKSEQWQDVSKIPHPSTIINQRRWEGSAPPPAKPRCLRFGHPTATCSQDGCRYE